MKGKGPVFLLILLAAAISLTRVSLEKRFKYPFNVAAESGITFTLPQYGALDIFNIIFGQRQLGSDIAWIQTLQYYGTPESKEERKKLEESGITHGHYEPNAATYGAGKYYGLLKYCERVVWLDPFFQYAYLYGAASLAWNLGRDDEAIELLDIGINNYRRSFPPVGGWESSPARHGGQGRRWWRLSPQAFCSHFAQKASAKCGSPPATAGQSASAWFSQNLKYSVYWQLEVYKLAIIYKKTEKYKEMIDKLEEIVKIPNCPVTVRAILANIYKKAGNYRRSLALWIEIYESGTNDYTEYAGREIAFLRSKLGI
jgi:tetratricopeptide (TPR) repeat protein